MSSGLTSERAAAPAAGTPATGSGLGYMAVAVVLLGAAWPVTKSAVLAGATPMWFAFGRAGLSTLAAVTLLALLGRLRRPGRQDMPALLALACLQFAGFFLFSHAAVAWVPAGRTAILANTTTMWVVPLSALILKEAMQARRLVAAGVGLVGVVVLIGPWSLDWTDTHVVVGHLLLLAASLSWSLAMVLTRLWPPVLTMLELLPWCFGLATLLLLPVALSYPTGHWNGTAWTAMAIVGLLAAPFGSWCIMQATAMLPMMVTSTGFLATPAIGLLMSVLLLNEALTPGLLLGAGLILCGVLLAALPGRRAAAA